MDKDLQRVVREHEHLAKEALALKNLLRGGPDNLGPALESLSTFANDLSEHLLGEHDVLDRALARRGDEKPFPRAQFDLDLQGLRWDWEECLASWDEASAAREWELFAEHLTALLTRIRRRIAVETALLGP